MATLARTRAEHESRLQVQRQREERSKHLVVLIQHHLLSLGYSGALEALQADSGVSMQQFEVADNVELLSVLQEWEDYYEMRFARKPKLVRKLSSYSDRVDPLAPGNRKNGALPGIPKGSRGRSAPPSVAPDAHDEDAAPEGRPLAAEGARPPEGGRRARPRPDGKGARPRDGDAAAKPREGDASSLAVSGHRPEARKAPEEEEDVWENRIRKAGLPAGLAASSELRELALGLQRDMIQENPNVKWDDIAELGGVKRVLKESLVMPLRFPHLFVGLLQPWKGVLLHGPPGTGKTLLAKAVATECRTTFFNISASSIVSKWRGDSEKLVRVLFELARHHAPSTIFIDEIDALMGSRGDSGEHEGSRRMKTELLVQMDGLLACSSQVFLLAATNLPWELDGALLRRLEKRIHVPFPSATAREWMVSRLLPRERLAARVSYEAGAAQTDGYSGADLKLVCKEAAMRPLRRLFAELEGRTDAAAAELQPGPVSEEDMESALRGVRPTVAAREKYEQWSEEFGSV